MRQVHVDERKWPDRLHWQFKATWLGQDQHGTWLHAPSNTIARRGAEPSRQLNSGFVMVVPEGEWWMVEFYWDHPRHLVYVNIGTPPVWDGDRVTQIDLDLDVVLNLDGSAELLDEDEFLQHQTRYEYPDHLVSMTRAASDRAVDLVERRVEPFGSAASRWLDVARPDNQRRT